MKICKLIIMGLIAFSLTSCAVSKNFGEISQPDWYDSQQIDENFLYTYGTSDDIIKNYAYQNAVSNAYQDAARYIETTVESIVINNPKTSTLTTQAIKQISSAKIKGSFVSKRRIYKDGNIYVAFVKVSIPIKQVNSLVRDD